MRTRGVIALDVVRYILHEEICRDVINPPNSKVSGSGIESGDLVVRLPAVYATAKTSHDQARPIQRRLGVN